MGWLDTEGLENISARHPLFGVQSMGRFGPRMSTGSLIFSAIISAACPHFDMYMDMLCFFGSGNHCEIIVCKSVHVRSSCISSGLTMMIRKTACQHSCPSFGGFTLWRSRSS